MNKNLKNRILAGELVHGTWINLGSTVSAEIVGHAGFDWVLIDLEHGAGDITSMYLQLQALESTSAVPFVRIDNFSRPKVQRILDAGAYGVMFPQVQSADEAQLAVRSMYYPPKGNRGLAKMVRATGFGKGADDYLGNLEKNLVSIIQIETPQAVERVEAIAQLENVDVLFVGPSDLSLSMGIFGQFNHPQYQAAIKQVAQVAKKYGKACGTLLQNITEHKMYFDLGYRFIACGAESSYIAKGAADMLRDLKNSASN